MRKDAARNRRQIIDAARQLVAEGKPVALDAVAQAADVGVGTVYRRPPSIPIPPPPRSEICGNGCKNSSATS